MYKGFSSPFSGTFFQFDTNFPTKAGNTTTFSSPLLGIFSIPTTVNACTTWRSRFRPLSRVPFFNAIRTSRGRDDRCFRPLSWGLSFNFLPYPMEFVFNPVLFSSPFLGTFFQFPRIHGIRRQRRRVFVPFLGDFLSIATLPTFSVKSVWFSPPFLGTFFQFDDASVDTETGEVLFSSPFLGTFFQFRKRLTR